MKTILITRPGEKGKALADSLIKQNFATIYFPLIKIAPISVEPLFANNFDLVIFVSPNAVVYGLKQLLKLDKIAVVGKGTLQALNKQGFDTHIIPSTSYNSEGLLKHPELQEVQGKKILIVRGKNGREMLKTELQKRGALVRYMEVYERQKIQYSEPQVEALNKNSIDLIQISNQETLEYLIPLVKKANWIQKSVWLLLSERTKKTCRQYGIKASNCRIIKPGNEQLLAEMKNYKV